MAVNQKERGQGWLHRVVSGCTAQREPLSAEVGVQIQEDDYDLVAGLCVFTCNLHLQRALAAEGKEQRSGLGQAIETKSRIVTHHPTTQQHDRQLDALIMPAGSRQRGRAPFCGIMIIVSPAARSELNIY